MKTINVLFLAIILLLITSVLFSMTFREYRILSYRYETLRKQYGALSCKCNGIGPMDGFCLNKDKLNLAGNYLWCKNVAKELRRLFHRQSVYDFGAGLGWYGRALLANESDSYHVASYKAYDGTENIDTIFPDGFVEHIDLSGPIELPPKDWVLSLDVGEHIPVEHEQTFIQNLHRHNRKGIVLSWAVVGQSGQYQVNGRNNDYIKSIFQELGYSNDRRLEAHFRSVATLPWFKNTLMIFRKS